MALFVATRGVDALRKIIGSQPAFTLHTKSTLHAILCWVSAARDCLRALL
jgi:hypothetical protein